MGLSYIIAAASGATRYLFPKFYFYEFGKIAEASFGSVSAGSSLYLSLIACVFLLIRRKDNKVIGITIIWMALINTVICLLRKSHYWVQSNPAMDACLSVMVLPLILGWLKNVRWQVVGVLSFLIVFFVVASQSSTALMGLGAGFATFLLFEFGGMAILPIFVIGLSLIFFGVQFLGPEFLNTNGRMHIWQLALTNFWKDVDIFWGAGTGSFSLYGPAYQTIERMHSGAFIGGDTFVWIHNDWLKVLFENGIAGLSILILLFFTMIYKARKRPALASAIVTYGAVAFTQMNLEYPVTAILGSYLIYETFIGAEKGDCGSALPGRPQVTVKSFLGKTIQFFHSEEL